MRRTPPYCGMPSNFQRLIAYQKAVALAHELHTAVEHWPLLDRRTIGPPRLEEVARPLNGLIRKLAPEH